MLGPIDMEQKGCASVIHDHNRELYGYQDVVQRSTGEWLGYLQMSVCRRLVQYIADLVSSHFMFVNNIS